MKLSVYEPEEAEEKHVRLRLIEDGDGDIRVVVVDVKGDPVVGGFLLYFKRSTGTVVRARYTDECLGFQLDKDGFIKIDR